MNNNIKNFPVKIYPNANKYKNIILKENYSKSGIYRWTNLINGKSYIGSAKCLKTRLNVYYSPGNMNRQLNKGVSIIYRAILKNGLSNFNLDILQYCELNMLTEREQYYIDLLNPEYNILKRAGSRLGHKASE